MNENVSSDIVPIGAVVCLIGEISPLSIKPSYQCAIRVHRRASCETVLERLLVQGFELAFSPTHTGLRTARDGGQGSYINHSR